MDRLGVVLGFVCLMYGDSMEIAASLQGLYGITAADGQLVSLNWTNGESAAIGASLQTKGWYVDSCVPTGLDTTGKWLFTLARRLTASGSGAQRPLEVVGIQLADGSLHTTTSTLVDAGLQDSDSACDFALIGRDGDLAYVTGQMGNSRMRTVVFSFGGSTAPKAAVVVLDTDTSQFKVGRLAAVPTATLDDFGIMWLQMEYGAVSVPLSIRNQTKVKAVVQAPTGTWFTGLTAAYGKIYGILSPPRSPPGAAGSRLSWFPFDVDQPVITMASVTLPSGISHNGTAVTALSDSFAVIVATLGDRFSQFGFLQLNGTCSFRSLSNSLTLAGMIYEPFVF